MVKNNRLHSHTFKELKNVKYGSELCGRMSLNCHIATIKTCFKVNLSNIYNKLSLSLSQATVGK